MPVVGVAVIALVSSNVSPPSVVTTILGKVTGVASDSNGVYIGLGDSVTANLSDILTIRDGDFFNKNQSSAESGTQETNNTSTASIIDEVVDTITDVATAAAVVL